MDDPFLDPAEVLQQPDARAAMDGWNEEFDLADPAFGKFEQAVPDLLIIQVGIFLTDLRFLYPYAWMLGDIIIITGIALPEDFINRFAAVTAKRFVIEHHRRVAASFTTVITTYFL